MRISLYGWEIVTPEGGVRDAATQEDLLYALRQKRDTLLRESDWTQMPDCPLSEEIKNDWRVWRQQMRDITNTISYPLEYTALLPTPPQGTTPDSWKNWDIDYINSLNLEDHGD